MPIGSTDHGSTFHSPTYHLYGVRKTLRRLYAPTSEPNEAIIRALLALARLERVEPALVVSEAAALAPAA